MSWIRGLPYENRAYETLLKMPDSLYKCKGKGWLWLEREGDTIRVTHASGQSDHSVLAFTSTMITYLSSDAIGSCFETALTLHPVYKDEDRIAYADKMELRVIGAYKKIAEDAEAKHKREELKAIEKEEAEAKRRWEFNNPTRIERFFINLKNMLTQLSLWWDNR